MPIKNPLYKNAVACLAVLVLLAAGAGAQSNLAGLINKIIAEKILEVDCLVSLSSQLHAPCFAANSFNLYRR